MTAYDKLGAPVEEHGCAPRGSSARCPAHDDRNASLSIGPASQFAGVLLNCHARCSVDDILTGLGLTRGDLFDEPRQAIQGGVVVAEYPYIDEQWERLAAILCAPGADMPTNKVCPPAGNRRAEEKAPGEGLSAVIVAESADNESACDAFIVLVFTPGDLYRPCMFLSLHTANAAAQPAHVKCQPVPVVLWCLVAVAADLDLTGSGPHDW